MSLPWRIAAVLGLLAWVTCGGQDPGQLEAAEVRGKADDPVPAADALTQSWAELCDYFNTFEDLAQDHHWFVYAFGTTGAGDLEPREQAEVTRMCGRDGLLHNPVTSETLAVDVFLDDHLPRMIKYVKLATSDPGEDRNEAAEREDQTIRLTIFLARLALRADEIWHVSSTGDCQGVWGHDHWVLYYPGGTASISLGGGE